MPDISDVLWAERNVLEALLFRLIETNLILVAQETRFIPQALAEVEEAVARLRDAASHRREVTRDLARELGIASDDLSLDYLAAVAPEPARTVYENHRDGFMRLSAEIERVATENRRLAGRGLENVSGSLDILLGAMPELATSPAPEVAATADGFTERC